MTDRARCVVCDSEFTLEELDALPPEKHGACPACGHDGVPCDPAQDVTVKINWHEIRILTIWADNWARDRCTPQSRKALAAILQRLEAQRPDGFSRLTLTGIVRELQDSGFNAQLVDSAGNVIVPPKGDPS